MTQLDDSVSLPGAAAGSRWLGVGQSTEADAHAAGLAATGARRPESRPQAFVARPVAAGELEELLESSSSLAA